MVKGLEPRNTHFYCSPIELSLQIIHLFPRIEPKHKQKPLNIMHPESEYVGVGDQSWIRLEWRQPCCYVKIVSSR